MDNKDKKHYIYWMLTLFGAVALSTIFFFLIYRFRELKVVISEVIYIVKPLIYGASMAYLINPICNYYERFLKAHLSVKYKKFANPLAVAGSILSAIIIVYLLMMIIIPQVVNSVSTLINTVPAKLDEASAWLDNTLNGDQVYTRYIMETYDNFKDYIVNWISTFLAPNIQNIVEGVGLKIWNSVIFAKNMLIGIFVAIYLLAARRKFAHQGKMILASITNQKWYDIIVDEVRYANSMFVGFTSGKLLDSAIIGIICYVFSLLFKFPNAILVSAIIGVTNIIPFFGPFIGAVPAALLILIESPIKALWFLLFVVVLQQVDGNIIGPKILGDKTGLSSFWVLFAILVFGGLWGFVGMIIGVPLFAVIYDIAKRIVLFGLKKNGRYDMLPKENVDDNKRAES